MLRFLGWLAVTGIVVWAFWKIVEPFVYPLRPF